MRRRTQSIAVLAAALICAGISAPALALPVHYSMSGEVYDVAAGRSYDYAGSFTLTGVAATYNVYDDVDPLWKVNKVIYTLSDMRFEWDAGVVQGGTGTWTLWMQDFVPAGCTPLLGPYCDVYNSYLSIDRFDSDAGPLHWQQSSSGDFTAAGPSFDDAPRSFHNYGTGLNLYDDAGTRRYTFAWTDAQRGGSVPEPGATLLFGLGLLLVRFGPQRRLR